MRLVLRPLRQPALEFAAVTKEPIPLSLVTYFEVRSFAFPDRPTIDRLPVSVRLAAVANELKPRLILISDVLRRLEALEWQVRLIGEEVVVTTELSVEDGWEKLRRAGVSDHLLPFLEKGSDLPPRARAVRRAPARSEPPTSV